MRLAPMLLGILGVVMAGAARPAHASTPLNGAAPRPFYVFAHNPNTLADVLASLQAGANALEPDVTPATCGGGEVLVDWDSSFPNRDGNCSDTRLVDWLDGVHALAMQFPQLALVVFDIKSAAASAANGQAILDAVRTHLNTDAVHLNVVFSVGTRGDGAVFDDILGQLGPREGVQVDAEDDAADIVRFFFDKGYAANIGFGDGTTFQGPNLPRAHDKAAFLRASVGFPRLVSYVYTLNNDETMHSFINGGVDGIIPDTFGAPTSVDPSFITQLLNVVGQHPEIRLATRDDNPFQPALQSYGVRVSTSDDLFSGTDADITFTLNGCRGSSSITVDTGQILLLYDTHRMRDGQTDWTTLPSRDLGRLSSITVSNDGSGEGPDWKLVDVRVSSAGYLGADFGEAREYRASFGRFLDGGSNVTLPLTPNFADPGPTITCPAAITVPNAPGRCEAPVVFSPQVSDLCDGATAVSSPVSGSTFGVATTTVTSRAVSSTGQSSAPCTFPVTVRDVEPPVITAPAPVSVVACAGGTVAVGIAQAQDNCRGSFPATGQVVMKGGRPLNPPIDIVGGQVTLDAGSYSIRWVASDGVNTSQASQTVTVGAKIQAGRSFLVSDRATVKTPANAGAGVYNSGTGDTRVGFDSITGDVASVGPVTVLDRARVGGSVVSAGKTSVSSSALLGGPATSFGQVSLPPLPSLPAFPRPGGSDMVVNAGDTRTLAPGSYPSVTLGSGSTLRLAAGVYFFRALLVNAAVRVEVTPTTRIFVSDAMILRSSFTLTGGGALASVLLGFAGTDLIVEAPFNGTLVAPNAHVSFGTGAGLTFRGSFFAATLEVRPQSALVCEPGPTPALP